jgi:Do/DeqQ family serine protease
MNSFNRYLSGVLLLLIGILGGLMMGSVLPADWFIDDRTEVVQTEVLRSSSSDPSSGVVKGLPAFKSVAEEILPTVVYIETVVPLTKEDIPEDSYHDFDNPMWDRLLPERRARAVGSGVIISSDGYILTNNHVVEGAVENGIRVTLRDKRTYRARLVGKDPSTDLAVIRIDEQSLPQIILGDSDQVAIGDWVLAVGNPFRLRSTITAGIVSAMGRDVQIINDELRVESFIQTDAAINKGNSGGALVNTNGELIGINTAIASQTGNYQGYGFAVPINLASKVATDLMQYGEVQRALLGVQITEITYERAQDLGLKVIGGAEIQSVLEDGAAWLAGLKEGDIIRSVAGKTITEPNELQEQIALLHPGDTVAVQVWRSGKVLDKQVKLKGINQAQDWFADNRSDQMPQLIPDKQHPEGESPEGKWESLNPEIEGESFDVGFRVQAHSSNEFDKTELKITDVKTQSEAWKRGLREGDTILEVNGKVVEDLDALRDLMRSSGNEREQIMLTVRKKNGSLAYYELSMNE